MAPDEFWDAVAAAHRDDEGGDSERASLEADPLESEPESEEEDRADGIFAPQFVQSTGVLEYMKVCREQNVVPVQQFISMLDQEVVSLKHRGVGPVGGRAIFECLRHNQHIQTLDMEDNQLGLNVDVDAGQLDQVCAALRENQVITNIDLSYNNFAAGGCVAIAQALEGNGRIKELYFRGNNMGDLGAQRLAEAIGKSGKLTKLDVSDNGIGESGGVALGLLLSVARPLMQVDFSWNSVRAAGAAAIAEGLKLSSLVRLNLAWNGLGERGATSIGLALKENASLLFLDLSSNRIGEEGTHGIADGLRDNRTLRSLQLNGNPIGDNGVMTLIEAVGAYCSLRDLGLQDCSTKKAAASIFDPLNPTGRYTLDLAVERDRELLKRMKQLDPPDEAMGGCPFMNAIHDSRPLEVTIYEWPVPERGLLHFDYVSPKRAPKDAQPQRDEVFFSFRKELANPALSDEAKLLMLRSSATTHFWTCAQVRQMVQLVTFRQRIDAVVILFRRITDLESNFQSVVYSMLKPSESSALRARLGAPLQKLLPEDEPIKVEPQEQPNDMAVVFLTEEGSESKDSSHAVDAATQDTIPIEDSVGTEKVPADDADGQLVGAEDRANAKTDNLNAEEAVGMPPNDEGDEQLDADAKESEETQGEAGVTLPEPA